MTEITDYKETPNEYHPDFGAFLGALALAPFVTALWGVVLAVLCWLLLLCFGSVFGWQNTFIQQVAQIGLGFGIAAPFAIVFGGIQYMLVGGAILWNCGKIMRLTPLSCALVLLLINAGICLLAQQLISQWAGFFEFLLTMGSLFAPLWGVFLGHRLSRPINQPDSAILLEESK